MPLLRTIADRVWSIIHRRDPKFRSVERKFIRANPVCFLCGGVATTAHHGYPVHAYRWLEMVVKYWRPVCKGCHFTKCHNRNWLLWVRLSTLDVIADLRRLYGKDALARMNILIHANTLGPDKPTNEVPPK